MAHPPGPPTPPEPKTKPAWELRALLISAAIVVAVGGISRVAFGLVEPLIAVVGLDGLADSLTQGVPFVLSLIAAVLLSLLAANTESRGAGLGAWVGFGLMLLILRGLAAL